MSSSVSKKPGKRLFKRLTKSPGTVLIVLVVLVVLFNVIASLIKAALVIALVLAIPVFALWVIGGGLRRRRT